MEKIDRRALLAGGFCIAGAAATCGCMALAQNLPYTIANPVEVNGAAAAPVIGRLPGTRRMYFLPSGKGEFHRVGSFLVTRIARPLETGGTYEIVSFEGPSGSAMPVHTRLSSHLALLVMGGDVEVRLQGHTWRMMRGDFANVPPGATLSWTMRSDRSKIVLFVMGDRAGAAFSAMGSPSALWSIPTRPLAITPDQLSKASLAGDFQLRQSPAGGAEPVRTANLTLPQGNEPYVLLDGGGERFGVNTFYASNRNTGGQFLFIISEGGAGPGVPAHFHARHTEDFYGMDGKTLAWANGKAIPIGEGDFIQAPPRHLHGYKMTADYNRFVGFLTPGIFENFFTQGRRGKNGVGGRAAGAGVAVQPGFFGAPPGGATDGRPSGMPPGKFDIFKMLRSMGRGPDGYPLDVHGATLPLPKQDPVWTSGQNISLGELRLRLELHARLCSGAGGFSEPVPEEVVAARRFKLPAQAFV